MDENRTESEGMSGPDEKLQQVSDLMVGLVLRS